MKGDSSIMIESVGEASTLALGGRLAELLLPGDVVALHGELGAGKTRLSRAIAEGFGVDPALVSSPTFVLVNVYPADRGPIRRVAHVDAYRLNGGDEDAALLGWDRLLGPDSVVLVEWAERLGSVLPDGAWDIRIEVVSPESRRFTIIPPPGRDASALATPARGLKCPICSAPVESAGGAAPFCSERCRLVDLGRWLGGAYRVSRPLEQRDIEEGGS